MPCQPSVRGEKPSLDSVSPEANAGEEIDGIERRSTELERKWSYMKPRPRRECQRERDIGEAGGSKPKRHKRNPGDGFFAVSPPRPCPPPPGIPPCGPVSLVS